MKTLPLPNYLKSSVAVLLLGLGLLSGCVTSQPNKRTAGPWDLVALHQTPVVEWGTRTGLVQEVYYQGEPFQGKPTRIFAYVARPSEGAGPFPAMVLNNKSSLQAGAVQLGAINCFMAQQFGLFLIHTFTAVAALFPAG